MAQIKREIASMQMERERGNYGSRHTLTASTGPCGPGSARTTRARNSFVPDQGATAAGSNEINRYSPGRYSLLLMKRNPSAETSTLIASSNHGILAGRT